MVVLAPVLAAVLIFVATCHADENVELDKVVNLISKNSLEEANKQENGDVAAAVRYMIPVPIRVVIPVPQQQPYPPNPYPTYPNDEVEPIVAVPVGRRPTRYGPTWAPVGPPFLAVPANSQQSYPVPARYDASSRRVYNARTYPQRVRAAEAIRRTRSIHQQDLQAEEDHQEELTSDLSRQGSVQGIRRSDNPLKASTRKSSKGYREPEKRYRSKRQVGGYYGRNGYAGYARPTQVIVPPAGQVVIQPVPVPDTQYVPVPVYVPVPTGIAG